MSRLPGYAALAAMLVTAPVHAAGPTALNLAPVGAPQTLFDPARDACDGADVPDAPARALRDAAGQTMLFALHDVARAFRGPDLDHLKLDCRVALDSRSNPDPAAYDDRSWIAALWTTDGRRIEALVHHEFQASEHKGACIFREYIKCWWNAVVGVRSLDGGANFARAPLPAVVAAAPFRSDFDQGRHRGFFNPSNIFARGGYEYFYASTTGWPGQPGGVCLFRTKTPENPASWRAWTGKDFSAAFPDPYRAQVSLATHCATIAPFQAPVGAVVEHRGQWIAVFQAWKQGANFPTPGFYYATSADLLNWSLPRLLIAGPTLYDDPCASGGRLIAYPALLDDAARSRVFQDVGAEPWLYYAELAVEGCAITSRRDLPRVRIRIAPRP